MLGTPCDTMRIPSCAARCVVEAFLDIAAEYSVLVARSPGGETAAYPTSRNHHTAGVLTWAVTPSGLDAAAELEARDLARRIAAALGVEGLVAVERFRGPDHMAIRTVIRGSQPVGGTCRSILPLLCPHNYTGGEWSRLRSGDQGKRAEEADVVSRIGRRKPISADSNRAEFALAA